jgi:L-2-aminoadipate N-acetyltransferase (EC 2.3.1.-)
VIVGVTYDLLRWEERNLIQEATKLGHKVIPIYTKDFYHLFSEDNQFQNLDVVLQRNTSHQRALSTSLIFETLGYNVINDSRTLINCENKLITTAYYLGII